jgi:hypothetical protein
LRRTDDAKQDPQECVYKKDKMKNSKKIEKAPIAMIINKARAFTLRNGDALSEAEQSRLNEWCGISDDNMKVFDRLTTCLETNEWISERQKLGFYEHLVIHIFNQIHPEKIKRDNAIIWIMSEMMLLQASGAEMKRLQEWAEGSFVNKRIFDEFKKKMTLIEKGAKEREANPAYYEERLKADNEYFKSYKFMGWLFFKRLKRLFRWRENSI